MSKMNPAAKEFVPARLLKKRQEENDRLGELTEQMDKVGINGPDTATENGESSKEKPSPENSKEVQEKSVTKSSIEGNSENELNDKNSTSPNHQQQKSNDPTQNNDQHTNSMNNNNNNNNYNETDYTNSLQDLIDEEEDDRFLLNAGENLCEFNGEQFIIPCDDDYEHPAAAGYDFGNAEDNEDEDVCNAFEEFLDNLPAQ